jgi:hypothetical protein
MNNLFEKLQFTNRMLTELDNEMKAVKTLPYYEIFGNESEREKDIQMIVEKKKMYLTDKYTILENIQIECEKEKADISVKERELTLKKVG